VQERVTLAIVDLCPSRLDLSLPHQYDALPALPAALPARALPDWGARVLSRHCLCCAPEGPHHLDAFCAHALALLHAHLDAALELGAQPARSPAAVAGTAAALARFSACQRENDRTRRILEVAFDQEYAAAYMEQVLFD